MKTQKSRIRNYSCWRDLHGHQHLREEIEQDDA